MYKWLRGRLLAHIHVVRSLGELDHQLMQHTPSVTVIISVNDTATTASVIPLFFPILSVLLDGQVRFVQVARSVSSRALLDVHHHQHPQLSVLVCSGSAVYVYGSGDADCLTLPAVRLLLTVLAPSTTDMLNLITTLSLMMLALQPCLHVHSPLASLLTLSLRLCSLLLIYCFFVSYVMPEHELCQLFDGLLPVWRHLMLTSFGNQVRSDWLRYTGLNFGSFVVSYLVYVLLVAWFYRRHSMSSRYCNSLQDDDDDEASVDWYTRVPAATAVTDRQ